MYGPWAAMTFVILLYGLAAFVVFIIDVDYVTVS